MLSYGSHVHDEPIRSDALAVAHETMTRAKANIDLLVSRLSMITYNFIYPQSVFTPPKKDVQSRIAHLEKLVGAIPMSLRSWYEIVGSVCFIGNHPDLSSYTHDTFDSSTTVFVDPLVIDPIEALLLEAQEWVEDEEDVRFIESCTIPICPDEYHKANISGVTYDVEVPCDAIDFQLIGERHHTTFVDYLRISFQWGGFPGFEKYPEHQWTTEIVPYLAEGLEAL